MNKSLKGKKIFPSQGSGRGHTCCYCTRVVHSLPRDTGYIFQGFPGHLCHGMVDGSSS